MFSPVARLHKWYRGPHASGCISGPGDRALGAGALGLSLQTQGADRALAQLERLGIADLLETQCFEEGRFLFVFDGNASPA